VGLDLGSQVVKAVEITLEGPEPVVTGFARVEIPPGADRNEAVAEVLRRGKFRARQVVTSVAGQSVVVRYVQMPKMSEAEYERSGRGRSLHALRALERHGLPAAQAALGQVRRVHAEQGRDHAGAARRLQAAGDRQQVKLVIDNLTPIAIDVDALRRQRVGAVQRARDAPPARPTASASAPSRSSTSAPRAPRSTCSSAARPASAARSASAVTT
jgi:hypothetical protein